MKIGICGSMSVGKTTLVNALKQIEQFKDYKFATERSKYLRNLGIPLNTDSTLKGQTIFLAERCTELIHDKIITDRTIIDVIAFTKSAKSIDILNKDKFEQYASTFISEYDYIFYISPEGIEIENNFVRETDPEYRDLIDFSIKHIIKSYNHRIKNLHTISGTTDERIQQILNIINS
jgi:GTPase SAR1 family protein